MFGLNSMLHYCCCIKFANIKSQVLHQKEKNGEKKQQQENKRKTYGFSPLNAWNMENIQFEKRKHKENKFKFSICNENICVLWRLRSIHTGEKQLWTGHIYITMYGMLLISTSFYTRYFPTHLSLSLTSLAHASKQTNIKLNANILNNVLAY